MSKLEKQALKRSFSLTHAGKKVKLADPDPSMSPEAVMKFYASDYPELINSTVGAPSYEGDSIVFEFKTVVGTKG